MKKVVILSATSDIGTALSLHWLSLGHTVAGTYRTKSKNYEQLTNLGAKLFYCDISNKQSIDDVCVKIFEQLVGWDVIVLCPATQEPVSPFTTCNIDEWEESIQINFTRQFRFLYKLLPFRDCTQEIEPCVIMFAGGGTNNATLNYSAYTVAKIAQIKMCELLDAEITDSRFSIVGTGWVKTKIHDSTLRAGSLAGDNFNKTLNKLNGDECTPMADVINCCDWIARSPREVVSGRNFSVVFDRWGSNEIEELLKTDCSIYKLRRFGNNLLEK